MLKMRETAEAKDTKGEALGKFSNNKHCHLEKNISQTN